MPNFSDEQTDMVAFRDEHPEFNIGLLSFTLEYVLVSNWPNNVLMKNYNNCDRSCTVGQTEPCGCTCMTDLDGWADAEVSDTRTVKGNDRSRLV